jgi:MFS transporter, ACS family, hexuronate transporter
MAQRIARHGHQHIGTPLVVIYAVAAVGIGGMAGAVGAVLFSEVIGQVLQRTGHYWVLFAIGALAYLLALALLHMLTPRMAPVQLDA